MYERFTDRARKVMALANQEAQRFNHEYIRTEHILLGLVKEGTGVGANVLKNLDVDLWKVRLEVEKLVKSGPDMITLGKLPQTPLVKRAIEYAIEEAKALHHNYVGTEHLLLGLLHEQGGVAAQVLENLGLKLEEVREEIVRLIGECTKPDNSRRIEKIHAGMKEFKKTAKGITCTLQLSFAGLVMRGLKRKNWSAKKLAKKTGHSKRYIREIINGGDCWDAEAVGDILHALGMRAEFREIGEDT